MAANSSTHTGLSLSQVATRVSSFNNTERSNVQSPGPSTIIALLLGICITMFATAVNLSLSADAPTQIILLKVSVLATFFASVFSAFALSAPYLESRKLCCWTKTQMRMGQSLSVATAVVLNFVAAVSITAAKLIG